MTTSVCLRLESTPALNMALTALFAGPASGNATGPRVTGDMLPEDEAALARAPTASLLDALEAHAEDARDEGLRTCMRAAMRAAADPDAEASLLHGALSELRAPNLDSASWLGAFSTALGDATPASELDTWSARAWIGALLPALGLAALLTLTRIPFEHDLKSGVVLDVDHPLAFKTVDMLRFVAGITAPLDAPSVRVINTDLKRPEYLVRAAAPLYVPPGAMPRGYPAVIGDSGDAAAEGARTALWRALLASGSPGVPNMLDMGEVLEAVLPHAGEGGAMNLHEKLLMVSDPLVASAVATVAARCMAECGMIMSAGGNWFRATTSGLATLVSWHRVMPQELPFMKYVAEEREDRAVAGSWLAMSHALRNCGRIGVQAVRKPERYPGRDKAVIMPRVFQSLHLMAVVWPEMAGWAYAVAEHVPGASPLADPREAMADDVGAAHMPLQMLVRTAIPQGPQWLMNLGARGVREQMARDDWLLGLPVVRGEARDWFLSSAVLDVPGAGELVLSLAPLAECVARTVDSSFERLVRNPDAHPDATGAARATAWFTVTTSAGFPAHALGDAVEVSPRRAHRMAAHTARVDWLRRGEDDMEDHVRAIRENLSKAIMKFGSQVRLEARTRWTPDARPFPWDEGCLDSLRKYVRPALTHLRG